jgi:hypothetical protein
LKAEQHGTEIPSGACRQIDKVRTMAGINLSEHQKGLVAKIAELVAKLKQWQDYDQRDVARWHDDLAEAAHELHVELMATGNEPRHHRYMLRNRGVPPTDPAFYRHIHPAEDLLAFINNIHANDDPDDQTIDAEFDFRVYSRRWGRHDTYQIRRTRVGWWVAHLAISGDCDRDAAPYLYENFDQDGINYPLDLPNYFAWLWQQAEEQGLSRGELQRELDRLARWVSICEQNTPGGVFRGYSGADAGVASEAV